MNHFTIFRDRRNLRFPISDYGEQAICLHALEKFRDLLRPSVHHPAMNTAHCSENYLCVNMAYTARISTGCFPA